MKLTSNKPDIEAVVTQLKMIQPGFLPQPLFHEVSRISVSAIIELVIFRQQSPDKTEVLLFQRDPHDHFWSGLWANPGSVIRPTDADGGLKSVFDRILKEDLGTILSINPTLADVALYSSERGVHFGAIYWVELSDNYGGTFFDVTALPDNTVSAQFEVISVALTHYIKQKAMK